MKLKKFSLKGLMKKPWIKYVGIGVAAYLVFFTVMVPADRVYGLLQPKLKENNVALDLFGLDGSLWSGSAQLAMISGKPLRNVEWDLNPTELVLGQLSTNLAFTDRKSHGEMKVTRSFLGTVRVKDVRMNVDVMDLLNTLKIPALKLDGVMNVDVDRIVVSDKQLQQIDGKIVWNDAGMRFPQKQKLGDLTAQIETTDKGIRAVLKDAGGPLELNGEFVLQANGTYTFNGQMMAREGVNSNLGRTLLMAGRLMPDNKVVVNTSGNLTDLGLM